MLARLWGVVWEWLATRWSGDYILGIALLAAVWPMTRADLQNNRYFKAVYAFVIVGLVLLAHIAGESANSQIARQWQQHEDTTVSIQSGVHAIEVRDNRSQLSGRKRPAATPRPALSSSTTAVAQLQSTKVPAGALVTRSPLVQQMPHHAMTQPKLRASLAPTLKAAAPQSLPPPIFTTPMEDQSKALLALLNQTPNNNQGVWLSQIIDGINAGQYRNPPGPNEVNYTSAVGILANTHQVDIIDAARRDYIQSGSAAKFLVDFKIRPRDATNPPVPFTPQQVVPSLKQVVSTIQGYAEFQITLTPQQAPLGPAEVQIEFDGPISDQSQYSVPGGVTTLGISSVMSVHGLQDNVFSVTVLWPSLTPQQPLVINYFSRYGVRVKHIGVWQV